MGKGGGTEKEETIELKRMQITVIGRAVSIKYSYGGGRHLACSINGNMLALLMKFCFTLNEPSSMEYGQFKPIFVITN